MDARSIGHEFVRQYYELLHDDPGQLHRFYLDNSTYIHASENQNDLPVVGQQAIYEAINRMSFSDCRTRIRQVDAQTSLQKSLVVQVVGEISNSGQPMRPFVQTFILAESAENKFYVNNDMFRYQDHIVAPESGEQVINVPAVVSPAVANGVDQPITNGQVDDYFSKPTENHSHLNGDVAVIDTPEPVEVAAAVEEPVVVLQPEPTPVISEQTMQETIIEAEPVVEVKQETKPAVFSWASVAGSSSSSTSAQPAVKKVPAPAAVVRAPEPAKPIVAANSTAPQQPLPQQQAGQRPPRRTNGNGANGSSSAAAPRLGSGNRQNGGVPDNQQIFVGGLNQGMSEDDIKGAFREFGNAIDIRMTQKQFCFVAFDAAQIVDTILANAKDPGFSIRGQRLNVEEKKEKVNTNRVQGNRPNAGGPTGGRGGRVGNGGSNYSRGGGAPASRAGRDTAAAVNQRR